MKSDIDVKTPDMQLVIELQNEFGFSPIVSRAVLGRAKEIMGWGCNVSNTNSIGQMQVLAVSKDEHPGKPLNRCELVRVILTIDAGEEDIKVKKEGGQIALRRVVICRITDEAYEQDGLLTQEDLARYLRCSPRTIRNDVKYLKSQGIFVPLRGAIVGMGRGQSHKVKIVEWYLKGDTYTQIRQKSYHTFTSIQRYIQTFARVAMCIRNNVPCGVIRRVINVSEKLVQEYTELYNKYNTPEYKDRIDLLVSNVKVPANVKVIKKRGVI